MMRDAQQPKISLVAMAILLVSLALAVNMMWDRRSSGQDAEQHSSSRGSTITPVSTTQEHVEQVERASEQAEEAEGEEKKEEEVEREQEIEEEVAREEQALEKTQGEQEAVVDEEVQDGKQEQPDEELQEEKQEQQEASQEAGYAAMRAKVAALASKFRAEVRQRYALSAEDSEALLHLVHPSNEAPVVRRLMRKIASRPQHFVFGWTGTSVTAAHDNMLEQGYPAVFAQRAAPVFLEAGLQLESRNAALGGNPILPYTFCTSAIAGDDLDVLSWEQEMMAHGQLRDAAMEMFLRRALAMPTAPSTMFISSLNILDRPPPDGKFVNLVAEKIRNAYRDTSAAPGVFQVTEAMAGPFRAKDQKWLASDDKCCSDHSWHPSPHGHAMIADVMANYYIHLLEVALQRLAEERPQPPLPPLKAYPAFASILGTLKDGIDTDDPEHLPDPQCFTSFTPTTKDVDLPSIVVNKEVIEDVRPRYIEYKAVPHKWVLSLAPSDVAAVGRAVKYGANYLDFKFTLFGGRQSPPIKFELVKKRPGKIVVCSPPAAWDKWAEGFGPLVAANVAFLVDGGAAVVREVDAWKSTCVATTQQFSAGKHTLTAIVSDASELTVMISHVVFE